MKTLGFVRQIWRQIRLGKWAVGFVVAPVATAKWFKVWLMLQRTIWLLDEYNRIAERKP